ncbi:MAG: hypothetical protein FJ115_05395 [Deltaproteobacteria bacterium]|nr:hypothetical protein [Deltaproteobacteria bacterium]
MNESGSPQNVMPAGLGEPDYDSLSESEASAEYQQLFNDRIQGKNRWSSEKYSEISDKLFRKAYSKKIEENQGKSEQESQEWLEAETDRIERRDSTRELGEARREAAKYFGGESAMERVIEQAESVLEAVKREEDPRADYEFLKETGLAINPRIIEIIANLHGHKELYPIVRKIGVADLLKLGQTALRRREKK